MANTHNVSIRPRPRVWQELRTATNSTNAALAEKLGVTVRTVERVIAGDATPSADFIACALVAFPFSSFDRLFTVGTAR